MSYQNTAHYTTIVPVSAIKLLKCIRLDWTNEKDLQKMAATEFMNSDVLNVKVKVISGHNWLFN